MTEPTDTPEAGGPSPPPYKLAYDADPGDYDFGRVREDGVIEVIARAESVQGLIKRGTSGQWTVISDEPRARGGDGLGPAPMQFFALGAVFCELTQITRFAKFRKVEIRSVRAEIVLELTRSGSVLRGDLETGGRILTRFEVEVDEDQDQEQVKDVLRVARAGCWGRQFLADAMPFSDVVVLNGQEVDVSVGETNGQEAGDPVKSR